MTESVAVRPKSSKFAWEELTPGYTCLSPMVGVTDSAFRQLCKRQGADVLFTEMASANMMLMQPQKSKVFLHYEEWERPIICQLMGGDVQVMVEAAKMAEDMGFDGIDINMGCPEKKIVGNACGSSLLIHSDTAVRIVNAMANAVSIPISVKMRSGFFDGQIVQPHFGKLMEEAGARALAIHPRTKQQGYHGQADWSITKQLVESVNIPVGGSGDVTDKAAIARLFEETGAQGVWVARGSMGNPWVFNPDRTEPPTIDEVMDTVLEQAQLILGIKGPHGIIELRKHLTWYFSGFPGAVSLREQVKTVSTYEDLEQLIQAYRNSDRRDERIVAA